MVLIALFLILSNIKKGHRTRKWHPNSCQLETARDCSWVNRWDFARSRGSKSHDHQLSPIKIQSRTSNVVWSLIQENERKFLDDCQGSLLQLPQLCLLSVSGLRDPLWHRQRSASFDSLELCLYLHLCLYLYLYLSGNSDLPSAHSAPTSGLS